MSSRGLGTLALATLLVAGCGEAGVGEKGLDKADQPTSTALCQTAQAIESYADNMELVLESPTSNMDDTLAATEDDLLEQIGQGAWSIASALSITLDKGVELWQGGVEPASAVNQAMDEVESIFLLVLLQEQQDVPGLRVQPQPYSSVLPTPAELEQDGMSAEEAMEYLLDQYNAVDWRGLMLDDPQRLASLLFCDLDRNGLPIMDPALSEQINECNVWRANFIEASRFFAGLWNQLRRELLMPKLLATGFYAGQDVAMFMLGGKLVSFFSKGAKALQAGAVSQFFKVWGFAAENGLSRANPLVKKLVLATRAFFNAKAVNGEARAAAKYLFSVEDEIVEKGLASGTVLKEWGDRLLDMLKITNPPAAALEASMQTAGVAGMLMAINHGAPAEDLAGLTQDLLGQSTCTQ